MTSTTMNSTATTQAASPTTHSATSDGYERIGEYRIHPAASEFPLLEGEEFEGLVESIQQMGQVAPIIQSSIDGLIIDGRNRLRAIERLRADGHKVSPRIVKWRSDGDQTDAEYIQATNLNRRNLTDDQRAMIAAKLVPIIAREAKQRQEASQCKKGEKRNPKGVNQHTPKRIAESKSPPPSATKQSLREKEAGSTRGKVAKAAKVTPYKAAAALDVQKSGNSEVADEVIAGKKSLAQAFKEIKPKKKAETTEPYDLEKDVTSKWTRWLEKFDVADRPEVRAIVARLIKDADKKRPKAKE